MKIKCLSIILCAALFSAGCEDYYNTDKDPVIYGDTYFSATLNTDKACYKPAETVHFTLGQKPDGDLKVRYSHLGKVISEELLIASSWSWTPPTEDYKGYMVDLYEESNGKVYQSIAVDVSSDWIKFPRYGFLSAYGKLTEQNIRKTIAELNRFHINGIQFYDWMHDHHRPLAGSVDTPLSTWPDLIGRTNYLSTIQHYIRESHSRGMKTMFYNLAFGALEKAAYDGVKEEWYLFKDKEHHTKDFHHLDAPFRSSIYLTNPANSEWKSYLSGRHAEVYEVLDFDGYHIDQLGNRGILYDYYGNPVVLEETYSSFLKAMKQAHPDKRLVMNAVSQYGQEKSIAASEVDFLYTEVWDEAKTFGQLAQVILDNNKFSNYNKPTVLAAYMNYARSNNTGFINEPGILLTNAVIFAFGGAHLELGEHYLANEYFPNSNLRMRAGTKEALMRYYDFLVGYQNILRDGGTFSSAKVESVDGKLSFQTWPASQGSVAVVSKKFTEREVIHLINFTQTNSIEWRDTNGSQNEPVTVTECALKITTEKPVSCVWLASPDLNGGVAQHLDFSRAGNEITVTLPFLTYWDMIVMEY